MIKHLLVIALILAYQENMYSNVGGNLMTEVEIKENQTPQYLYKILATQDWNESQHLDHVRLSKDDQEFIHLATKEQLDGIINKYWSNAPDYVILKVDTMQLTGKLVYETNPGGSNRYYHLYEGSIPVKAVVEVIK